MLEETWGKEVRRERGGKEEGKVGGAEKKRKRNMGKL